MIVVAQYGLGAEAIGGTSPTGTSWRSTHWHRERRLPCPAAASRAPTPPRIGRASPRPRRSPGTARSAARSRCAARARRARAADGSSTCWRRSRRAGGPRPRAQAPARAHDADTDAELRLLLEAVSRGDPYTSRHADDVVELARWVGGELGLDRVTRTSSSSRRRCTTWARCACPADILHAPRALDKAEREVMGMHPVWSFEIVAAVPGLEAVAPLVRAHHERWDGTGYPDGLAGSRIPLPSRIVAACDAVGALTTDRPYRRAARRSSRPSRRSRGARAPSSTPRSCRYSKRASRRLRRPNLRLRSDESRAVRVGFVAEPAHSRMVGFGAIPLREGTLYSGH